MSITANWSYPTAIRFGAGRISEIAEACAAPASRNRLLITDRGLASMDITTKTLDLLEAAGLGRAMFSEVDPNPNEKNCRSGRQALTDGGHDGVVAFGGGSGLDLGKWLRFLAGQTRPFGISRMSAIGGPAQMQMPLHRLLPCQPRRHRVEVGRASVITNSETEQKKIIFHPKFLPAW